MAQRLPEWNDPEKGPKLKQNIKSFALKKVLLNRKLIVLLMLGL